MAKLTMPLLLLLINIASAIPSLNIQYATDYSSYNISVNNKTWLQSGETAFRSNGHWASLKLNSSLHSNGYDNFGNFNELILQYTDTANNNNHNNAQFATHFRTYASKPNTIVFIQSFLTDINSTKQHVDGIISAFPSFLITPPNTATNLGYVHFGGHFTAFLEPQFGAWSSSDNTSIEFLSGGLMETGPLALFDENNTNCLVISALTDHMAVNDNVEGLLQPNKNGTGNVKQMRWGIQGNVDFIPSGYKIYFVLTAADGGVNTGMQIWGDHQLEWYNKKTRQDAHARDFSLNYLGYSTDHGAFYYYYTEDKNTKNYQDTILDIYAYHQQQGIPTRYILLDSWWYYQGRFSGVSDWSAMPQIFPDGLQYLFAQTGWRVVAHNRYWSADNVYQTQYNFTMDVYDAMPLDYVFWDDLFKNNTNWGLMVYEQDWLSRSSESLPLLLNSLSFGRQWLRDMANAAMKYDVNVEYCMSFPRHVMTSVELPSVTQTRVSGDYLPGDRKEQWRIGTSSIFALALGLAASKDSIWTMRDKQPGPYLDSTHEPWNRLQAAVLALSNGPIAFGDQIGYSNKTLIMRWCNDDGLLLRPDVSATSIDRFFTRMAFKEKNKGPLGEVWTSRSSIAHLVYVYVFTVELFDDFLLLPNDLKYQYVGAYKGNHEGLNMENRTWLAFESNATDKYITFDVNHPLRLQKADKYDFQLYSLIDVTAVQSGWVLAGEISKWITFSSQRFVNINEDENGLQVEIYGAVGEHVQIAFADLNNDNKQVIVDCVIADSQSAIITMPAAICEQN